MLVLVTLLLLCVIYILVNYYKTLRYWKDKGIKHATPLPIIGNLLPTFLQSITYSEYVVNLYKQFPDERFCGTFQYSQPILLLKDLNLIKRIFTTEFNIFSEHPSASEFDEDSLWGKNLFAAKGETWRHLRQVISPSFSTSKLKSMFVLMDKCAGQMMEYLNENNEDVMEIELRDLFKRYSSDAIATIAFGIECNSFKDRNNDFIRLGAELTNFGGIQKLKRLLYSVNPKISKLLNIKMHPDNVTKFFRQLVKNSIKSREDENYVRPDYIQHLLEFRKGHHKEDDVSETIDTEFLVPKEANLGPRNKKFALELTDDVITAQAIDFFYGGFYSTASLMSFCVYELAINPEIQENLQKEVDRTLQKDSGKISYDALTKMKYLDMVISETLRKWPTATWIDRKSNKSIVIEDLEGKSLYLEAGTVCWLPVFAIQRDPKYWPDPEKFDPERFNEVNRKDIFSFSFLPFGAGPRSCVGSRFAIMEAKLIIVHILSTYEVVSTEKSIVDKDPYLTGNSFWFGLKSRQQRLKQ